MANRRESISPVRAGMLINRLNPDGTDSVERQIVEHIRALIVDREFPAEYRLPSTRCLANRWGVNPSTVHFALTALVKQGFLNRVHGRGTFVRRRKPKLACIGVYENYDYGKNPESAYSRALCAAVHDVLSAGKIRTRLWIDQRPATLETDVPMAEVVTACARREVQGVIALCASGLQAKWLSKLPVPVAIGCSAPLPCAVTRDRSQFIELSLRELARLGCRSVGLFAAWAMGPVAHDKAGNAAGEPYERFFDLTGELKLVVRQQWIKAPPEGLAWRGRSVERYGYEQFRALWQTQPHPDGLIVEDDIMARGVITGLLETGVRVPQDLKLVLHRNREVDLLCPMPASFVELSIRATAEALVSQIEKQFRGEPCERVALPYRLVKQKAM